MFLVTLAWIVFIAKSAAGIDSHPASLLDRRLSFTSEKTQRPEAVRGTPYRRRLNEPEENKNQNDKQDQT
jgi:hypothetical protein